MQGAAIASPHKRPGALASIFLEHFFHVRLGGGLMGGLERERYVAEVSFLTNINVEPFTI